MEPSKNNTQTEEDDTIALKKKRARRVSFADNEITSVHVFRRDDDDSSSTDNPPDPSVLGFSRDLTNDSDDDERPHLDADASNSFLRPIGSPSPGGSSTADNGDEDDDFHGPVSACFIRPDGLSDSGASDEVTMDSTAFSLQYQSLARSDSGDIKTRQVDLTTPSSHGSSMDLTEGKKLREVLAADVESGGGDSNDMSIEGEHVQSYRYDRLSPALDAILAGGSKGSPNVPVKVADSSIASPVNQVHQIQAFGSPIKQIEEFAKDSTVPICRQLGFANAYRGTPVKVDEDRGRVFDSNRKSDQVNQNPIHGSTPLSVSGSKQLFTSSHGSSRYAGNIIPALEQSGKFGPEVCVTSDATPSSVHKSISKMKILDTTPSMSSLKEGIDILKALPTKPFLGRYDQKKWEEDEPPKKKIKTSRKVPFSFALQFGSGVSKAKISTKVLPEVSSLEINLDDFNAMVEEDAEGALDKLLAGSLTISSSKTPSGSHFEVSKPTESAEKLLEELKALAFETSLMKNLLTDKDLVTKIKDILSSLKEQISPFPEGLQRFETLFVDSLAIIDRISVVGVRHEQAQEAKDSAFNKLKEARKALGKLKELTNTADLKKKEVRARIVDLKKQLKRARKEEEMLNKARAACEKKRQALIENVKTLTVKRARAMENISSLDAQCTALETRYQNLRAVFTEMRSKPPF
ncbi:uncharacterized protein LOC113858139 [Abrus precatorius]|uniref:Uncharacterized protein LOC113858139 n=1 Tax=Abrus precatorius TaxID=3816 RepID=A0A8B8KSY1_ABRPR|nr:uncharacterized protein LOC113858139 [Abrus precatorius]